MNWRIKLDRFQTYGFGFRIDFRYPKWIEINFLKFRLSIYQKFETQEK